MALSMETLFQEEVRPPIQLAGPLAETHQLASQTDTADGEASACYVVAGIDDGICEEPPEQRATKSAPPLQGSFVACPTSMGVRQMEQTNQKNKHKQDHTHLSGSVRFVVLKRAST